MIKAFSNVVDLLPLDHEYLTYIKKVLRHRCRQAGFRRITPSLLEPVEQALKVFSEDELRQEAVVIEAGKNADRSLVRFNPLFSVARTYQDNNLKDWPQPVELYAIDPFLKKREGGQVSMEQNFGMYLIGSEDSALSAQMIFLASQILGDLGLQELYTVQVNHIGSLESRKLFLEDLKNFYFDKQRSLCESCRAQYERSDLLKLLRCREEDCMILAQLAPQLQNYLQKKDQLEYKILKDYLTELGISFRENRNLFCSGPFQANTIFEFWHNDLGAKNTILSGGSNDTMIEKLGGERVNIIGFSSNVVALVEGMKLVGIRVPHKDSIQVFIAQLGVKAKMKALSLLQKMREIGIKTVGAMGTGSMRTQLDMATDFKVRYTILMGEVEVNEGMVIVRDMQTGTQEPVPYGHVLDIMQQRLGNERMDVMEEDETSIDLKKKKS